MNAEDISFSVVVPTRNRPDDVERCVASIADQTRPPEQVVVVDDGDLANGTVASFRDRLPGRTDLTVTSSDGQPGSSVARNTGIRRASEDVVVFLDDDVELGSRYLACLADRYEAYDSDSLAGIGGIDGDDLQSPSQEWWSTLFYQGDPWQINRAGMSTLQADGNLAAGLPTRTDWLVGNNLSFRREVVEEHPFPQWTGGREPHEDLAVGWSLKRDGYHCVVDPSLPFTHHREPNDGVDGQRWVDAGRNRVNVFQQYGDAAAVPLFAWAVFGEIIQQLVVTSNTYRERLQRAGGLFYGALLEAASAGTDPTF